MNVIFGDESRFRIGFCWGLVAMMAPRGSRPTRGSRPELYDATPLGLGSRRFTARSPSRGSRPELYDLAPLGLRSRELSGRLSISPPRGSRPELYDAAPMGLRRRNRAVGAPSRHLGAHAPLGARAPSYMISPRWGCDHGDTPDHSPSRHLGAHAPLGARAPSYMISPRWGCDHGNSPFARCLSGPR